MVPLRPLVTGADRSRWWALCYARESRWVGMGKRTGGVWYCCTGEECATATAANGDVRDLVIFLFEFQ